MAKWLTLNTHSWMEVNALKKLFDLAEHILAEKYDLICLQEINQLMTSEVAPEDYYYQEIPGMPELHKDNFALLLVNYLAKRGQNYYWSWAYNHIGYDIYHEGVAILSKNPIKIEDLLVTEANDEYDFHTRRVLLAETIVEDRPVAVTSLHLSWFGKGFEEEWAVLEGRLADLDLPLMLMGDFNNPTDGPGYQMVMASPLELQDSHKVAEHVFGNHSIVADIDGWEENDQAFKVDHAFMSKDFLVKNSEITFEGGTAPVVSDHFGLSVETEWLSD
ncbi:exodeoxyribonuclease III [Streptococcus bovimastitidis]|uniref:Exodeoxyribonuclease III n=1 Tax=Streptococcus bovimastitidis TaxID=1856638 RepID=A0A1L8MKS5_9STRE|nr:endonuclease/exonuclease/phosphatase family protein [Streptococcus bovimastitidis]OJF71367.1 exodeoxyribonuclease III [Streptococcus bovimastitidis]